MKKILAIIMTICLMASVLCVPAFAAGGGAASGDVITVGALKKDGKTVVSNIASYEDFEEGWNAAMKLAGDTEEMKAQDFDRIIVDIKADWKAVDGEFSDDLWNGPGFDWDTIYIPEDARVTVNLNGHTIDRGLTAEEDNGEVIFIDEKADVIINNGTIKGGWSDNGAGGIHIVDKAKVTLNDVHIEGNAADCDDGGGIAMYDGASLTMNGGSFKSNKLAIESWSPDKYYGGAISVKNSVAVFNGVRFEDNQSEAGYDGSAAALYAFHSRITLNDCIFDKNGLEDEARDIQTPKNILEFSNSSATIKNCTFTNNGSADPMNPYVDLISINDSTLTVDTAVFSNNAATDLINSARSAIYVSGAQFLDNNASVMLGNGGGTADSYFKNCIFKNNTSSEFHTFARISTTLTFYDCDLGDSTFDNQSLTNAVFEKSEIPEDKVVLRVSTQLADGTVLPIAKYDNLVFGWTAAMRLASAGKETDNSDDRIIVDLCVDWTAKEGKFSSSGIGFKWNTLYFPENVSVTLNMNGHTIDRALTESENDGEVMFLDDSADVIINDGTIKGGYSENGAGGIHMAGKGRLTLNNVNLVGNRIKADDGAAIAMYNGSALVMNGGSVSNNSMETDYVMGKDVSPFGTIYVNDSAAILNGVKIDGNQTHTYRGRGVAIYATGSTVKMDKCTVSNNATRESVAGDIIYAENSELTITDTDFTKNNRLKMTTAKTNVTPRVFYIKDSTLTMTGGRVTQNGSNDIFYFWDTEADMKGVTITDNTARAIYVNNGSEKVTMTECTLGNNTPANGNKAVKAEKAGTLVMTDCTLGNTTFDDKSKIEGVGSLIGEGSLTNILVIISLAASAAAIILSVTLSKRKLAPAIASVAPESDDEE